MVQPSKNDMNLTRTCNIYGQLVEEEDIQHSVYVDHLPVKTTYEETIRKIKEKCKKLKRKCVIHGRYIEEYYWGGVLSVSVNHLPVKTTYEEIIEKIKEDHRRLLFVNNVTNDVMFHCPRCDADCFFDAPNSMNIWQCPNCVLTLHYPGTPFLTILKEYRKRKQ